MTQTETKSIVVNKAMYVNQIFSKIAKKYDLLNNLMTFGMHKKWKEKTIKLALQANNHPEKALDLCSGTGDLGIILNQYSPLTKITCVDNCNEMLEIARTKITNQNLQNLSILLLDSEELPFNPKRFDLITIGFGLRNLVKKEICLENVYKLLTPGGVFACIDLGYPTNPIWGKIFYFYFFKIVPILGQIFANEKDAYTYLPTSLKTYYKQEELKELILKKGFQKCFYKNIFGGVVAIHVAIK